MHQSIDTILNCTQSVTKGLINHLGVHQRSWMQTVDGNLFPFQFFGQIKGKHHERKFTLAVGFKRIIVALQHHVAKIKQTEVESENSLEAVE